VGQGTHPVDPPAMDLDCAHGANLVPPHGFMADAAPLRSRSKALKLPSDGGPDRISNGKTDDLGLVLKQSKGRWIMQKRYGTA
jgi:hypothetical protein